MNKLHFQLVTPEKTVLSEELASLSCPTTLGQITILPGHIPLVATLVPGELVAKTATAENLIHITGGFVEVRKNSEVIVLADGAEHYFEIDEDRAKQAVGRAQQAMKETKASSQEYAKVATQLERSLSRLKVARKHSHKKNPLAGQGTLNE